MAYRLLAILTIISLSSCYSFRSVSIAPEIRTFTVNEFGNRTNNAPATISQEFSEALRDKVTNESRLNYVDSDADVEFDGDVTGFTVRSVAPTEGNTTALTRLEIRVNLVYTNNVNEDESWSRGFSFFWDFESGQDLLSIQDELIANIFDKIVEDVFNAAFSNW